MTGMMITVVVQKQTPPGRQAAGTVLFVGATGTIQGATYVVPSGTTTICRSAATAAASVFAGRRISKSGGLMNPGDQES